jgi:multiple sugar transport system substrate-binding protein
MQRKSKVWSCVFFLLVGSTLGCSDGGAAVEGPAQPYKGAVLRVACPAGAPAEVIELYARGWAARNQVKVDVRPLAAGQGPTAVDGADIWIVPPVQLPRWAAAGRLLPLPRELTSADNPYHWNRLLPLYREKLLGWDRQLYGLPLLGESFLCCYRADLFADEKHRTAYAKKAGKALAPPATWEDFEALADYFHGAGQAPSLPPLPADDDVLEREFFTLAVAYGRRAVAVEQDAGKEDPREDEFAFHYDLKTGQPRITAPGFVHALRLLQRLQKFRAGPPAASSAQAFRDGRAVLCLTDATHLLEFQTTPALRDRFGVCRMPGGSCYYDYTTGARRATPEGNRVPYLGSGGWLAVVPQGAAHPEAAFALLAELSGPKVSSQIVVEPRWGGGAIRDDHFRTARWDAFDLDPARTTAVKEALRESVLHQGLRNPVLRLRTPDEEPHRLALVAELRSALTNPDTDAAQALDRVAQRWSELDKARGEEAHLAEYRISLGLLPR